MITVQPAIIHVIPFLADSDVYYVGFCPAFYLNVKTKK